MYCAGDLVDVVAHAGQLCPQLVKLRRQCAAYRLEKHPLPCVAAEGKSCRLCVAVDLSEFIFVHTDDDAPCAVLGIVGVNHLPRRSSCAAGAARIIIGCAGSDDGACGICGSRSCVPGFGAATCIVERWRRVGPNEQHLHCGRLSEAKLECRGQRKALHRHGTLPSL